MTQTNAQAMDGSPQQQSNLFLMGSQPMVPQPLQLPVQQPMTSMASSVAQSQAQHMHMQMQQRQQQQQFAAAMAARRNAQQQQQAVTMAAMMGQQGVPASATHAVHQSPQMNANPGTNIHVASLIGNQGVNLQANTPSGVSTQPHQLHQQMLPDANGATPPHSSQTPVVLAASATSNPSEEPCVVCRKKGDIFTCNGGCGLHAHPACIGEDAIFPFVVGQLCGSCFIVQQNRASPEDLTKGGPHALSVRRAILCLNLETNSNSSFDKFGHLASLRLGEIGSRACIAHGLHGKVIELMKARKFSVMDFFGWHPAIEGPNVRCSSLCAICGIRNPPELDMCSRCHHKLVFPSAFTKYVSTLLAAFYAEQVGIPLGASTLDVFAHTNTIRGMYKGLRPFDADGVVWDVFTDQLRMIFGFLDIMSNFGTLQLNPDLFVPEMNIIFNPAYVNQAMITNEFEVVGKFLQCMKLFGDAKSKENENMIGSCERYLLFKHLPNGSWCKINGSTVEQYKATVTCSKALLTPTFRGYGPISHEFQRLLEKWARNAAPKLPSAAMTGGKQPADSNKVKLLASGATVKTNTQARLKRLEAMYKKLEAESKAAAAEGKSVKTKDKISVKVEVGSKEKTQPAENEAGSEQEATPVKKEEGAAESTTDSEDVKSEHHEESGSVASAAKDQDDDDMLTSMSLHEDLEIFDGLQFEDGGGIIDMNFSSLGPQGDTEEHAIEDADGTDAPGQNDDADETMDEHVVDDDDDDNEDDGGHAAGEMPQQETSTDEAMETADNGEATTDFPEM
ncbi:uncharacterized protein PITG_17075 [Phytophthora infestans T30-4]|uniref:Uncharacterized protein n=1 Tax=Phytophthora infestans (strain T30-4) TaxID=403677 RepID=D0NUY9_PHYIT|nr:uncharacterized protein PITG_17075 [Phytophthora infestans T30-4]EEY66461.1 conserved hypothetical protein [Phytophthora infestans T30-4]|eukprot:XP_002896980.1 conserved hypothetical protein [Phytophthora infestans T30-4]